MSFYPLLSIPGFKAKTTIYNFAPNNWESKIKIKRYIVAVQANMDKWHVKTIDSIDSVCSQIIDETITSFFPSKHNQIFITLNNSKVEGIFDKLPEFEMPTTNIPAWRATISIYSEISHTSYQGEIDPFPDKASLFSFAPFIQTGKELQNYFMLLNLEMSPVKKSATLEFIDAINLEILSSIEVINNQLSIYNMSDLCISDNSLLLCRCNGMTGIPLYFSHSKDKFSMSLEHTHPPGSMAILGRRWEVQKTIKSNWANVLP